VEYEKTRLIGDADNWQGSLTKPPLGGFYKIYLFSFLNFLKKNAKKMYIMGRGV